MRSFISLFGACLIVAGTVSVACGNSAGKSQVSPSADAQKSLEAYFHEVANVSAAHQASRLKTSDPLDPYSPDIPPLIDEAANALAQIKAPRDIADLHDTYAKSVKAFAVAASALARHHDEVIALASAATPTTELVALLSAYDTASTAVGDACVTLQEIANANKIDVDIGCRGATAEFKCYATNSVGTSKASNFDDARARVESVVGSNVPIPTNIPAWITDYQVGLATRPVEPGDPDAADIRFASYGDRSRPQVVLAFTPRPYCSSRESPAFSTTTQVGATEIRIVSDDADRVFKGISATLRLSDVVVTIRAFWETARAPSYDDMVPTIVQWAGLVLDKAGRDQLATPPPAH